MAGQDTIDYARFLVEHGNTVVSINIVKELLEHIDAQDALLDTARHPQPPTTTLPRKGQ